MKTLAIIEGLLLSMSGLVFLLPGWLKKIEDITKKKRGIIKLYTGVNKKLIEYIEKNDYDFIDIKVVNDGVDGVLIGNYGNLYFNFPDKDYYLSKTSARMTSLGKYKYKMPITSEVRLKKCPHEVAKVKKIIDSKVAKN